MAGRPRERHPNHLLFCTFCRSSEETVAKLLAGPGVYICDGCVGVCNRILADEPTGGFGDPAALGDGELVARLAPAAAAVGAAESGLRSLVATLRARGVTWSRIGGALGISRQAAWDRFSGEE